jgi:hypothetical protein
MPSQLLDSLVVAEHPHRLWDGAGNNLSSTSARPHFCSPSDFNCPARRVRRTDDAQTGLLEPGDFGGGRIAGSGDAISAEFSS